MDPANDKDFVMSQGFYRALEDEYRGSRDLIKERLSFYLQFITPLLEVYPDGTAIDIGCGRGEWLELLMESGFRPLGIDQDKNMLDACYEHNLPVRHGDGLEYISSLPNESKVVISAFHVIEHVSFQQILVLIKESLRVLKPGGVLILETPNPENIVVATNYFYIDPTHLKPIPPALLEFATRHAGFLKTKIVRLQESSELAQKENISLMDVLRGPSPDYGVVALKSGADKIVQLTNQAYEIEYGFDLESVGSRWEARQSKLERSIAQLRAEMQFEIAQKHLELQTEMAQKYSESIGLIEHLRGQLKEHEAELYKLQSVYTSTSWKITKPLRICVDLLRNLRKSSFLPDKD